MEGLIPIENIAQKIYLIRGQKVMLDSDLAVFYGVETKQLNRQVRRNIESFPEDFMYVLTKEESNLLRCQIGTLEGTGKYSKYLPYVFTELGVSMLSSVLKSKKARLINISIMRAFVKIREYLSTSKKILDKLKKHDDNFVIIFNFLKQLSSKSKEQPKRKQIGFRPAENNSTRGHKL
ncbi:MAG: ORF6N domain-containing protein [bacterium]